MMRRCQRFFLQFLLPTPFDHQSVAVPSIPTTKSMVQKILPSKSELSRVDEVGLLLKHLPAACDKAKELQHDAQYASRYYRARFRRGSQLQHKQCAHVASLSSPAAQKWARAQLIPITDPFHCL
ncbi:hypothetical protein ABL78_4245 [Leptomonas seymouri]|uniref:Uncharacterized protein n=1 Tax=Leptomonas seymouri TaxID=5684 RepID=A0A0N0P630_LEPSE|nr:hypothetical protein ABL78_4245 [Leptomonas seymouri]|eukprot:KPI86687.1 hypothetical protein ABL78_4245 [Leptomonas seymouri]